MYKYLNPTDYSDLEWRQHFDIDNYTKIVLNEKTGQKRSFLLALVRSRLYIENC